MDYRTHGCIFYKPLTVIEKKTNPLNVHYFFTVVYLNTIQNSHRKKITNKKSQWLPRFTSFMSLKNIFSFLVREMLPTYANEIKLRTLYFFKFSPKYVFLCRSNLFVLDILFNRQMFCWWFILNNSTFYEFVLIFLFPGMALSYEAIFLTCAP